MVFAYRAFVGSPIVPTRRLRVCKRPRSNCYHSQTGLSMTIDAQPASKPLLANIKKPVRIALTREDGKNDTLYKALRLVYPTIEIVHTPCVVTKSGEHQSELPECLTLHKYGWIVITSPEAANVFIRAWKQAKYPEVGKISVVGKATADVVKAVGFRVAFMPSKATGKTLVNEFPATSGNETVLYPASAKASNDIVQGLTAKGYLVRRLNTYSTETACFDDQLRDLGEGAHIVTFASPSAVRGWVQNIPVKEETAVACIGVTSANAAKAAGFSRVHYPEKPGMEGWISAVSDAMILFKGKDL